MPRLRDNGVDGPNSLGVTLREFIEHEIAALEKLLSEQFARRDLALELQAQEYERRLHDLNGEYQRDRQRQADYLSRDTYDAAHNELVNRVRDTEDVVTRFQGEFVRTEKYEDRLKAEANARDVALLRINERFDEYITRWEQRQREVDQAIAIGKGAADQAQKIAEDQGRKANRNIAVAGVALTGVIILMNFLSSTSL